MMAIKNDGLGGSDWLTGEHLRWNDLNDTYNKIQELAIGWQ